MSAHTPDISLKTKRPWIVRGIVAPALGIAVYSADGDCVCGGLTVADAHLIAAAPDLLTAAQAAYKLIDALMPGVRHIALQDYRALNETPIALAKAIAKAEGKS